MLLFFSQKIRNLFLLMTDSQVTHENCLFFTIILFFAIVCIPCIISFIVVKKNLSFLNFIRAVAAFVVFVLHASIFTNKDGTLFNSIYMKALRLPAWGGYGSSLFCRDFLLAKDFH